MKNIKFKKQSDINVYNLISERIKMQSTKNSLTKEFGMYIDSATQITTPNFVYQYFNWHPDTQNAFLDIIVGKIYKKEARHYFNDLKEKYDKVIWQTQETKI